INGPLIVHDMPVAADAAAAGIGIALIPDAYCGWAKKGGQHASWKDLVRLLPDYAVAGAELSLVSPPVAYEPARVRLFREFRAERIQPAVKACAVAVEAERARRVANGARKTASRHASAAA